MWMEDRELNKVKLVQIYVKYTCTTLRACLHGGGGPQVGEVTRLAVVEKWPAFTCKVTTPGSRGDVTRRCCKCNMNSTPARRVTPP